MSTQADATPSPAPDRRLWLIALILLAIGGWLRLSVASRFQPASTEEALYGAYVKFLSTGGVTSYPDLVERCVAALEQKRVVMSPMRVTHLVPAVFLKQVTAWDDMACLNTVAAMFSFLALPLALLAATRMGGLKIGLATLALMVCGPTQIFTAGRAGVDGIVCFWALATLWTLWESLQKPEDRRWAVGFAASLALLVLTKENSIYILGGIAALLLLNRWLKFAPPASRGVLLALVGGLGAGYALLLMIGGGFDVLALLASEPGPYSVATGDGPWHRYLFDLAIVSPLVLIVALTRVARIDGSARPELFLAAFVGVTYLLLLLEPMGANLRYVNFWDFPLRFLAASAVLQLVDRVTWRPLVLAGIGVGILAVSDLSQYHRIFVARGVTDPLTPELLRAEDIVKSSVRP